MASGPERVLGSEVQTASAATTTRPAAESSSRSGIRDSLRGKGYDEQVAMLSPRGARSGSRPTLRIGSKSDAVAELQQSLNNSGAGLEADGAFGPATQRAVKAFQRSAGLASDGVVGSRTWARLDAGDVSVNADGGASGGAAGGRTSGGRAADGGGPAGGPEAAAGVAILLKVQKVHERLAVLSKGAGPTEAGVEPGAATQAPAERAGLLDDLGDAAADAYSTASGAAGDVASTVADTVGGAASTVADTASSVADTVSTVAGDAADKIASTVGGAADTVAQTIDDVVGGGAGGDSSGGGEASGGDTVLPDPASAWDAVKATVSQVRDEVQGYADDLRRDHGAEIDAFLQALNDLGKPLTVDLGAVGASLDGILAGLNVTTALGGDTATPLVEGPAPAGAIVFDFKEPRKRSEGVSEPDFYLFKDKLGALTNAQLEGSKGSVLYVLPDKPTVVGKPTLKDGQVTKVTLTTQDQEVTPHWVEYNADKSKYHPLKQKAWETAHTGMVVHEDGHVAIDRSVFNSANIQDLYGQPEAAVYDKINELVTDSDTKNQAYDDGNRHGINGTPSTQVGAVTKSEEDQYDEDEKKKKEGKK